MAGDFSGLKVVAEIFLISRQEEDVVSVAAVQDGC